MDLRSTTLSAIMTGAEFGEIATFGKIDWVKMAGCGGKLIYHLNTSMMCKTV